MSAVYYDTQLASNCGRSRDAHRVIFGTERKFILFFFRQMMIMMMMVMVMMIRAKVRILYELRIIVIRIRIDQPHAAAAAAMMRPINYDSRKAAI